MIIIFALVLAALAMIMQRRSMANGLDSVREDHWIDKSIVELDETFHVVLSLKNTGPDTSDPWRRISTAYPTSD